MADSTETMIGLRLGGYRLEALVGRGGMGEVYRAHDDRLDRNVALKILAPRLAGDEIYRERLLRESRLAASLDHPNVVPVYEAGEIEGRFFLAMRYVEGTDLRALLRRSGALEPSRALEILAQVGAALDAAHERGLVHRDVKPSNVLIDEGGHCYLADFGLTQSLSDRDQPADGQMMGTLHYVAPEQVRGEAVDGRADVYSLACMFFEMLTGDIPFQRASDVATIYAHLEEEPPSLTPRRPGLPTAIDDVLSRAMAKDRENRHETCAALVDDARVALGIEQPSRSSRQRLAPAGAVAALLIAAVVATVVLLRGGAAPAAVHGSLIRVDPVAGKVTARYPVSAHPGVVTTSKGRIWLGDYRDGSLSRLNPLTGDIQRLSSVGEPRDLTSLGGTVWVASDTENAYTGTVTKYDSITGARLGGMDLLACAIGAGESVVWATGCPFVQRVSTDDGPVRVLHQLLLPYPSPRTGLDDRTSLHDIAVGEGSVWVTGDMVDRRVWRLDPKSGRLLATIRLPVAPRTIAAGAGGVWVTAPIDDLVVRIDPTTNRVTDRIPVGRGASGVAVGGGGVWVTNSIDGTVSRIDTTSRHVTETIAVGGQPRDVAFGAGGVWVTADAR